MACQAIGTAVRRKPAMAAWATAPGLARKGSSNFRASAGLVGASILASAMVAWSLETKIVGLSMSDRSIFSPRSGLPSAK